MSLSREEFLRRIRSRLQAGGRVEPPSIDGDVVRTVSAAADVVALFIERAREAGMDVEDLRSLADPAAMRTAVADLLHRLRIAAVTLALGDDGGSAMLRAAVREAGCTVVDHRASPRLDAHYDVDAGVTDTAGAIAETGTLVVSSADGRSRGAFIVPPVHIALVRSDQIVADHLDYWRGREAEPMPAATVFVTGPSKTADIEGILITGVHGPRAVHIIVI